MAFAAKYISRCSDCDKPILIGDQITDQDGWYVHTECASEAPKTEETKACQKCWLVHRGECF